jgi:hypothetical protein
VASFYQYIDHERLIEEVVAQTGDDLAIMASVELLYETSHRVFGLPQVSDVSDVLANLYIEPIRRHLVRGGYDVWRFSDDFRVACNSYGDALAALELCDEAARDLGLVLSERKTATPKRDTYQRSLTETARLELSLLRAMRADDEFDPFEEGYQEDDGLIGWSGPDEKPGDLPADIEAEDLSLENLNDDEPSEQQVEAAQAVMNLIHYDGDQHEAATNSAELTTRLLRNALAVLTQAADPVALDKVSALLVYYAPLTPHISGYLRACARDNAAEVRAQLNKICRHPILSPWQALWLAYVAGEIPPRRVQRQSQYVKWLVSQMRNGPAYVRAEAALAAARLHVVSADDLLNILPDLPQKHRATALIGLTVVGATVQAIDASETELDRLRIAWANRNLR